ncbi:MAG: hypothetical protein K6E18_02265, partial [Lachnospiraceae bacterium]|nr:hypothetical protein [Lachnospiraceae bacterium]
HPALLAFYTSHHPVSMREQQCMAYSTDGVHFEKYRDNPVIPGADHTPARDPFVFKNAISGGFSMCFTTEKSIRFYHTKDLLTWKEPGEYVLPDFAFHGMIECPSVFFSEGKCVLLMSMDIPESEYGKFPNGAAPHSRLMQYLVGDFDGIVFTNAQENDKPLLVDAGLEFYAGTLFHNTPEPILMAWLGNSEKIMKIPTEKEGFRGVLCYPRKLSLVSTSDGYRLRQEFYPAVADAIADVLADDITDDRAGSLKAGVLKDSFIEETISKDGLLAATNVSGPEGDNLQSDRPECDR